MITYEQFLPDFTLGEGGQPDTKTGEYNNPVAVLNVTPTQGEKTRVYAFYNKLPDNIPISAAKAGYKWKMTAFEKSPLAHILSVKYDPFHGAFIAWYFGGFGLIGALMFVFFLSPRRVWAQLGKSEGGKVEVVLAGEANRNQMAFTDKFAKIANELKEQPRK